MKLKYNNHNSNRSIRLCGRSVQNYDTLMSSLMNEEIVDAIVESLFQNILFSQYSQSDRFQRSKRRACTMI